MYLLFCGIQAAKYEVIVTIDDDLQHPPEEIPKLLDKLAEGYDVVYGKPLERSHTTSKGGADLLAHSYWFTYNLPIIITRSSNNFGPYQYPEKLIPLFITNALDDLPLPLYGNGKNIRDWIYVLDNCEAIDLVLHKGRPGEVYNISAGNEEANIEIAEFIVRELGKPINLIKFVKDRLGHDRRYSMNSTKIYSLGFTPRYGFKEALRETIKRYKENEGWWRRIKEGEFKEYYRKAYI